MKIKFIITLHSIIILIIKMTSRIEKSTKKKPLKKIYAIQQYTRYNKDAKMISENLKKKRRKKQTKIKRGEEEIQNVLYR